MKILIEDGSLSFETNSGHVYRVSKPKDPLTSSMIEKQLDIDPEIKKLKKELNDLKIENEILKKAMAIFTQK